MTSCQYRKSHCGDKTILWSSYLHNGISYTDKTTPLYWIGALELRLSCTKPSVCFMGCIIYTLHHYDDVIMSTIASQITSLTIVYSSIYSGADQSKHQSSASLALMWGIHRGPVNSPHKWPVTRKMFPFDYVIMTFYIHIPVNIP